MTIGLWILGDRLDESQTLLELHRDHRQDVAIVLIESLNHIKARPYHRQKLVLVWSAMRHFAAELQAKNWDVSYLIADDFATPLVDWICDQGITKLQVMEPHDRPFRKLLNTLNLPCPIEVIPDNHFLWSQTEFKTWTRGKKKLLLEYFYRAGRQKYKILMDGKEPIGGVWNFDKDNRNPPKTGLNPPPALIFTPDDITQAVIAKVQSLDLPLYGKLEPFTWGVTRIDALAVLADFIEHRLPTFGTYQDAMITGEFTLWHSLISPYLNIGLLRPLEVIQAAEIAYHRDRIALNQVEGFIRQILGWREYMYGLYHYVDEDYFHRNWFNHDRDLPEFFWHSDRTDLNCLHQTLKQIEETGYAHHIQRLMILGNFALISGINPQQMENWFHATFVDAYDWVMQTNVLGMALFADGGILASKPYAASANYINKMSDYCRGCKYDPKVRLGEKACPFNYFYWDFLHRHRDCLTSQGRMSFILKNLDKISPTELATIADQAQVWWEPQ
jgi:deoxyribodipyrimidine photolyase-related protein